MPARHYICAAPRPRSSAVPEGGPVRSARQRLCALPSIAARLPASGVALARRRQTAELPHRGRPDPDFPAEDQSPRRSLARGCRGRESIFELTQFDVGPASIRHATPDGAPRGLDLLARAVNEKCNEPRHGQTAMPAARTTCGSGAVARCACRGILHNFEHQLSPDPATNGKGEPIDLMPLDSEVSSSVSSAGESPGRSRHLAAWLLAHTT